MFSGSRTWNISLRRPFCDGRKTKQKKNTDNNNLTKWTGGGDVEQVRETGRERMRMETGGGVEEGRGGRNVSMEPYEKNGVTDRNGRSRTKNINYIN